MARLNPVRKRQSKPVIAEQMFAFLTESQGELSIQKLLKGIPVSNRRGNGAKVAITTVGAHVTFHIMDKGHDCKISVQTHDSDRVIAAVKNWAPPHVRFLN